MALWSHDELSLLKDMSRRGDFPGTIARATGHTIAEVDLALWTLLGRSIGQAADVLNMPILCGQGAGSSDAPRMAR